MQRKVNSEANEGPGVKPRSFQSDYKLKALARKAGDLVKETPENDFLSAKKLNLTERQRTALIKTLALMESGGIDENIFIDNKKFSMRSWIGKDVMHPCRTVCCIGGTATLLDGSPRGEFKSDIQSLFHDKYGILAGNNALYNLFYLWGPKAVTVERAAKQLRHYLNTDKCQIQWGLSETPE